MLGATPLASMPLASSSLSAPRIGFPTTAAIGAMFSIVAIQPYWSTTQVTA